MINQIRYIVYSRKYKKYLAQSEINRIKENVYKDLKSNKKNLKSSTLKFYENSYIYAVEHRDYKSAKCISNFCRIYFKRKIFKY